MKIGIQKKDPLYNIHEYSWSDHGYALVSTYYSEEPAELLDKKFSFIREMSYNSFNKEKHIDTSPFRRSIWYFVHRLYGILHDDFNYGFIVKTLDKKTKKTLKNLTLYPNKIHKNDTFDFGIFLQASEKIHIIVLATEARMQAELLYGLHAVVKYQTHSVN